MGLLSLGSCQGMKKVLLFIVVLVAVLISCTNDPEELIAPEPSAPAPVVNDTSPVVFDMSAVPYPVLSTYHFFDGAMADLVPVTGLLPFEPITPLFTDYAHKQRLVWMPAGTTGAHYVADEDVLAFPDGAVLIKTFYYDNVQPTGTRRIMETRLMFKRDGAWESACYKWNAAQTEAVLDMAGSINPLDWVDELGVTRHVDYRIPAAAECHTCHKRNSIDTPIGTKPQNLNSNHAYASGTMNQLAKWSQMGYLQGGYPSDIATTVKWDDPTQSLTDRVRAYVDMNCSHCHDEYRHCDYRPMRFAWDDNDDLVNMGVCVPPEDLIDPAYNYIVSAGLPGRSMLYHRFTSTAEDVRMPLLGRTVVHEEAAALFHQWISTLTPPCN